jgi:hypothetical protein
MLIACLTTVRALRQERLMRQLCHGAMTIDSREKQM